MIFLYTEHEGARCKAWPTFLDAREIMDLVNHHAAHAEDFLPCDMSHGSMCAQFTAFTEGNDVLPPEFHSIILPNAARWDALHRTWMFRVNTPEFKRLYLEWVSVAVGRSSLLSPVLLSTEFFLGRAA